MVSLDGGDRSPLYSCVRAWRRGDLSDFYLGFVLGDKEKLIRQSLVPTRNSHRVSRLPARLPQLRALQQTIALHEVQELFVSLHSQGVARVVQLAPHNMGGVAPPHETRLYGHGKGNLEMHAPSSLEVAVSLLNIHAYFLVAAAG